MSSARKLLGDTKDKINVGVAATNDYVLNATDIDSNNHTIITNAFQFAVDNNRQVNITSDIIVSGECIVPTNLKIKGNFKTIKIKNGVTNFDLFKGKNFDSLSYTNLKGQGGAGDTIIGSNNVHIENLILDGNEANVTASTSSLDNRTRKALIKKYGYNWTVLNCRFINAKENAIYKEWALSSGMTQSSYFDMEDYWDNIKILNFGFNGVIDRGPNDSIWANSYAISYRNGVENGMSFETSPLFTSSSCVLRDVHTWGGPYSGNSLYFGGALIIDSLSTFSVLLGYATNTQSKIRNLDFFAARGSIYSEGTATNVAGLYLQAQNCILDIFPSNAGIGVVIASNNNIVRLKSGHGTVTALDNSVIQIGRNASGLLDLRSVVQNDIQISGTVNDLVNSSVVNFVNDGGFNNIQAFCTYADTNSTITRGTIHTNTQVKTRDVTKIVGGTLEHNSNKDYSQQIANFKRNGDLDGLGFSSFFGDPNTSPNPIVGNKGDIVFNKNATSAILAYVFTGTNGASTGWTAISDGQLRAIINLAQQAQFTNDNTEKTLSESLLTMKGSDSYQVFGALEINNGTGASFTTTIKVYLSSGVSATSRELTIPASSNRIVGFNFVTGSRWGGDGVASAYTVGELITNTDEKISITSEFPIDNADRIKITSQMSVASADAKARMQFLKIIKIN